MKTTFIPASLFVTRRLRFPQLDNRIVGDLQPGVTKPVTRTNIKAKFQANTPLLPSGLIGPVKLAFPVTVSVKAP